MADLAELTPGRPVGVIVPESRWYRRVGVVDSWFEHEALPDPRNPDRPTGRMVWVAMGDGVRYAWWPHELALAVRKPGR